MRSQHARKRTLRETFSASADVSPVLPASDSASARMTCSICRIQRRGAKGAQGRALGRQGQVRRRRGRQGGAAYGRFECAIDQSSMRRGLVLYAHIKQTETLLPARATHLLGARVQLHQASLQVAAPRQQLLQLSVNGALASTGFMQQPIDVGNRGQLPHRLEPKAAAAAGQSGGRHGALGLIGLRYGVGRLHLGVGEAGCRGALVLERAVCRGTGSVWAVAVRVPRVLRACSSSGMPHRVRQERSNQPCCGCCQSSARDEWTR